MRGIFMSVGALLLLNLASCVVKSSDEPIDQALLAQYRTAIPKETQVSAKAPNPSMAAKLGDPAIFPRGSNDIVMGINGSVKGMIDMLGAVVALEPTLYNSDTKEFVWGPYDNDNGIGTIAVYIKEANGDFKYEYAFLRGIDKDEIKRGMVISHPGKVQPHSRFKAEVYILKKEEGGRHTPFHNKYRPQFYIRTLDVTGEVQLPEGVEMVMPGDNVTIIVDLIYPVACNVGLRFAIREGGRTVGAGQITELLE